MTPQPEMSRRVAAAQATLDRFKDRPFAWGAADCSRLVAFHLRQLGHNPGLARAGGYSTLLGARRALAKLGHRTLAGAVDALGFARIAPAAALVGDVMQMPGIDDLGALAIVLTNGRVLGFHEQALGAAVLAPKAFEIAWRVPA